MIKEGHHLKIEHNIRKCRKNHVRYVGGLTYEIKILTILGSSQIIF